MNGPKPTETHPMKGFDQVCYLKNVIRNPHIIVGDYSYYDDPLDSEGFERNVLYHYPFMEDKLIIGKFCAINFLKKQHIDKYEYAVKIRYKNQV